MTKPNRSSFWKLFGKPSSRGRKPPATRMRCLRVESLEPRALLSGTSVATSLNALLASITPDPHPCGDQPADLSQEVALANYTAHDLPPGSGLSPAITQFVASVAQLYTDIQNNAAARPAFWCENVAGQANQARLHLDDNGMLISNWSIDWGDGSDPQSVAPQPWVIHQYAAAGQYTIAVTANSPDGSYSAATRSWFADSVGIGGSGGGVQATLAPAPPTLHVGGPQIVAQGQTFALDNLASFSYLNAANSTGFTYSLDWGDGSPPMNGTHVNVIAAGGSSSPFLGALASDAGDGPLTHDYGTPGNYYLAVTVTANDSGLSDTQTIPIHVVALTPVISGLPTGNTCPEGTAVNLSFSAAGDPSLTDPAAYNWQIADSEGNIVAQGTDPNFTYAFTYADTYTVSLVASVGSVTSAPATAAIVVNSVAPTITSAAITGSANVGQTFTLSAVSFTASGVGDTHSAAINWNDGSTPDDAQVNEPYLDTDGITEIPGTISDSHVFSASGNYTGTITLTDECGNSVTQDFTVNVAVAAVSLNSFAPSNDGLQFQVSYTIANAAATTFNIGIYTSPDGTTPGSQLTSVSVDGTTEYPLTVGTHTASFTPIFDDIAADYHLIAVTDANSDPTQNTVEFAGGVFFAAGATPSPTQNFVYVFGAPGIESVSITTSSVQLADSASTTMLLLSSVPNLAGIHVRGENGEEILQANNAATVPLWLYGGASNDILDGSGQNVVNGNMGGDIPKIVNDAAGNVPGSSYTYHENVPAGDPGWTIGPAGQGFAGTEHAHVRESNPSTTAVAVWTFDNLDPSAYYDVYVTWSPTADASTAAQYVVRNDDVLVYPLGQTSISTVDQTQIPADFEEAGVYWHDLGVFRVPTSGTLGTLVVQLTSYSTDPIGSVLADAAMIVPDATVPLTNLTIGSFGVDSSRNLSVTYTINGENSPPFSIGIYGSPDGRQAANLLQTYDVTDPTLLAGGGQSYTVSFTPGLSGDSSPCLVAMLDAYDQVAETTKADNVSAALSGEFQNSDGVLYVMGSAGVNENVTFSQDSSSGATTVSINGVAQQFTNVSALYVSTGAGNDTIDASGANLSLTAYAGSGNDTIIGGAGSNSLYGGSGTDVIYGGTGNAEIYGGSGNATINGGTGNNFIQAGSGDTTIFGGPNDDWIFGGSGNDIIYAGNGQAIVHGGSGNDHIYGGTGLDDIYGGSGTNWIYGNGVHDILEGGTSDNYILPNPIPGYNLGSIQVKDHANALTCDGTIDANGNQYTGDYQALDPGYGGSWTFNDLDSGVRLGEDTTTPIAVYANWQPSGTDYTASDGYVGTHWAYQATYEVFAGGTPLGSVTVDQNSSPNKDSPEPNDRPWTRLGVWNVPAGEVLTVELVSGSISGGVNSDPDGALCAGDVMIHAIWPTVNIRPTNVTVNPSAAANAGYYVDWVYACQPINVPVEGEGGRIELQLQASIEPLYYTIAGTTGTDWVAVLPNMPGLDFWTVGDGGTQLTPDGSGDLIDQVLAGGSYDATVYVSVAAAFAAAQSASDLIPCSMCVENPTIDAQVTDVLAAITTPTQKEVFAFEGRGGFPAWFTEGKDYSISDMGALNLTASPPQVLKYWRPAAIAGASPGTITPANPNGDVAWRYYSQAGVAAAEQQILAIAKQDHGGVYDTITLLGYSNGGAAAREVASWLKAQSIMVDLAITCDPVPKPDPADFLPGANSSWSTGGVMSIAAPANVTTWRNFYQNFDTDSLAVANLFNVPKNLGGLPRRIWGRYVTGATNIEVTAATPVFPGGWALAPATAHVGMPMTSLVTEEITSFIAALPSSRKSYTYTAP